MLNIYHFSRPRDGFVNALLQFALRLWSGLYASCRIDLMAASLLPWIDVCSGLP